MQRHVAPYHLIPWSVEVLQNVQMFWPQENEARSEKVYCNVTRS